MNSNKKLLERIKYLINIANKTLETKYVSGGNIRTSWVDSELFNEFEASSLSFIVYLYKENHPYYVNFKSKVNGPHPSSVQNGRGILNSIKIEIENDWLVSLKGLISAEIFTDYIETAEYLLKQNYKDAAAVIIGSTLEEHLRQLCRNNNIHINKNEEGKYYPKNADLLNSELSKAEVYNKLDLKNVTSWLDLRNKAAHGLYSEYSKEQVEIMMSGVLDFMTRNSI
ncbi:hypothetical protein ABS768_09820 [Flavobacterium sp. ST-75]|uniref:DUF4145 domain-containing protein n=1 Tax=Flavobacterium rhizophilum TaxID=3163296 RepID=A0ABW8YEY3_9FLAO